MPTLTTSNKYTGNIGHPISGYLKSFSNSFIHYLKNQSIDNRFETTNSIYKTLGFTGVTFKEIINQSGEPITLKKAITVNINRDGDYYCVDFDDLDIHCVSKSSKDVKEMFGEEISMIKEMYLDCDENELCESAKEFRKTVAEYI